MQIVIIGTGYVGLVTGCCLAEMGHHVTCLDIDPQKIEKLKNGQSPIYEPGLQELIVKGSKEKRLTFTTDVKLACSRGAIFFICVPTPPGENGSADVSYVLEAVRQVAAHITDYSLIVTKSTVPVGTSLHVHEEIARTLKVRGAEIPFDVVSNPEFLKEGAAVSDCMKPDRVIIGSDSPRAIEIMKRIYSAFTRNHERIFVMDITSAELTKYAANAMLATRISFMNELSALCEKLGANIDSIRAGIGSDPRIGPSFLYAGIGWGGSCFPKDVHALTATYHENGLECPILESVEKVNARQKRVLAHKIKKVFENRGGLKGSHIAIWGLSFKPDTDDMREAPSLIFIEEMLAAGAKLRLYDPVAMDNAKKILPAHPHITWCESEYECAQGCDAIALVTEWKPFRFVDLQRIASSMTRPLLFDGRNQYQKSEVLKAGFEGYFSIGR